ncbi:unnamed protein product, partial [Nesidiocoris tenuis]
MNTRHRLKISGLRWFFRKGFEHSGELIQRVFHLVKAIQKRFLERARVLMRDMLHRASAISRKYQSMYLIGVEGVRVHRSEPFVGNSTDLMQQTTNGVQILGVPAQRFFDLTIHLL